MTLHEIREALVAFCYASLYDKKIILDKLKLEDKLSIEYDFCTNLARRKVIGTKQLLLFLARIGVSRPRKHKDSLGNCLCNYISKTNNSYDKVFDEEIRKIRPEWF